MRASCPFLQPVRDAPSRLDEIRSREDEFQGFGEERNRFKKMIAVVNLRWCPMDIMVPTINGLFKHQNQIREKLAEKPACFPQYYLTAMPRLVL